MVVIDDTILALQMSSGGHPPHHFTCSSSWFRSTLAIPLANLAYLSPAMARPNWVYNPMPITQRLL